MTKCSTERPIARHTRGGWTFWTEPDSAGGVAGPWARLGHHEVSVGCLPEVGYVLVTEHHYTGETTVTPIGDDTADELAYFLAEVARGVLSDSRLVALDAKGSGSPPPFGEPLRVALDRVSRRGCGRASLGGVDPSGGQSHRPEVCPKATGRDTFKRA